MQQNNNAFTFVELIVVLVIIAILATIGFVSYESFLSTGRDTAKVSLMKDINTSFGTYSLKSRIPLPDNKIDITASGTIFAYQGDFTEKIAQSVGFKGNPYDDSLDIYPSYMLLINRKDTQLLHYLEDRQSQQTLVPESYAFTDYQILHPQIIGKSLGVLLDAESQEPLHLTDFATTAGEYDIVNGTEALRAYYSQDKYFENDIDRIIPNKNCKRILELGGSKGSGVYTISPDGTNKIKVYCDMVTDGGGWTFTAFIDRYNSEGNIFSSNINTYRTDRKDPDIGNTNTSYSIDASQLGHNEMMFSRGMNIQQTDNEKGVISFKYNKGNTLFYSGPLPCILDEAPLYRAGTTGPYSERGGLEVRTCLSWEFRIFQSTDSDAYGIKGDILTIRNNAGVVKLIHRKGSNIIESDHGPSWVYVR